jgi:N-acetyl-1-D-myo-inositol-2-amino-2-deoxy-alpha-D-glucopyranoside deacetylase
MADTGGLLVITAHPDDEALIAGGTLAACAAHGVPTGVVCLTLGEDGPISDPALATPGSLGETRREELSAACAQLGVRFIVCLRHEDGNLKWADPNAIVGRLVRIIERRRPNAVVSFGEDGLYYHPDHVATSELTERSVRHAALRPALYRAVWPPSLMSDLVSELRRRGLPDDLWGVAPEAFGSESECTSVTIDVRRFVERKLRALQAHRTQLPSEHAFAAIPGDLAERFLGFERFVQVGGAVDWLQETLGHA